MPIIKIKCSSGKTVEIDYRDAREVWEELDQMFGKYSSPYKTDNPLWIKQHENYHIPLRSIPITCTRK